MAEPKTRRVINCDTGAVLAERAELASSFLARFVGLMGRPGLRPGGGLVIIPCNSVHMFFMRFPLDILHLDKEGRVLRALPDLKPWSVGPIVRGSHAVVELPAGTIAATGTRAGHRIELEP